MNQSDNTPSMRSVRPSRRAGPRLVSVVVPAWNAQGTLAATLDSALAQTHAELEVIVVNDGSTDGTEQVAQDFARRDERVRVISTPNRGVAAARNLGIARALSDLVAPLDADDLWHPEKIARQLDVLDRGGPRMGLVYAGYRELDATGRVRRTLPLARCEGQVFLRSVLVNLVGNGSGFLARREALRESGGYDEELRRCGLEGTEDRLLQTLIARRWTVGEVPAYLVGYRRRPDAMSADRLAMCQSQLKMLSILARQQPDIPKWVLDAALALAEANMATAWLFRFRPDRVAASLARALALSPRVTLTELAGQAAHGTRLLGARLGVVARDTATGSDFFALSPEDGMPAGRGRLARTLGWIGAHEEAFAATDRREGR